MMILSFSHVFMCKIDHELEPEEIATLVVHILCATVPRPIGEGDLLLKGMHVTYAWTYFKSIQTRFFSLCQRERQLDS
jgi:hypothetical protein